MLLNTSAKFWRISSPEWLVTAQVGDASGVQSPLSFGGFGALTRHLGRVTDAVADAVASDALDRASLTRVNAYPRPERRRSGSPSR